MKVSSKDVSKKSSYGASAWWMDDFDTSYADSYLSDTDKHATDLYKMASHRRAIANFVGIVTNKSIPVKFVSKGDSFTDGKSVTISSKVSDPKEFDSTVGLALHEGSHIKLSDFGILKDLSVNIHSLISYDKRAELTELSTVKKVDFYYTVKSILNWVEDRRIDQYVFNQAPGYRDYYRAMYDKYFNDPIIEKALASNEFTKETIKSYMFRLINLHSKSTRLDALKSLRKISNVVDLSNISRLQSSKDALGVALEITEIILNSIVLPEPPKPKEPEQKSEQTDGGGSGAGDGSDESESDESDEKSGSDSKSGKSDDDSDEDDSEGGESGGISDDESDDFGEYGSEKPEQTSDKTNGTSPDVENDTDDTDSEGGMSSTGAGSEAEPFNDGSDSNSADNRLTDKQMKQLEKKLKSQEDFVNGDVKKSTVTKTEQQSLKNIEESGAELSVVGKDIPTYGGPLKGIECVVVKKMTESVMLEKSFPLTHKSYNYKTGTYDMKSFSDSAVEAGIRLGTMLGKRLQVRSEARETVYNRQLVGRLDKRMVSSLGFGNEHVFFTREIDKYNKANLHISIDASGSMAGSKWDSTMTNVVALAKAVDMIPNLQIQISFRTTQGNSPYVVIAYDSRVDKFVKIKSLFRYLRPEGLTPEGLCFEAILKYMVSSGTDIDSYFVNISDGEPYFTAQSGLYYTGATASKHTRTMVDNISKMGIRVLSYFVSSGNNERVMATFRECYGKAASFINVTNMVEVSRTMNALFMTKA